MSFHATPVTVLTGFLGSGKTTLINRLLQEDHGLRLAIIENEFGAVGIDADLIERNSNETIVQLANGCVCCTVRGDLANALDKLVKDRDKGKIAFDQIIIETTGLADPGPIVRTFLAETAILDHYFLDGVVTLIDGLNDGVILGQRREARAQLAYADHVLITKSDVVNRNALNDLKSRLTRMNTIATIETVNLCDGAIDFTTILFLKGFQPDSPRLKATEVQGDRHNHEHGHLDTVCTISWESENLLDQRQVELVINEITDKYSETLWRIKGVLAIDGIRQRVIVQGVNGLIQVTSTTFWRPYEPRHSRLVLIGEGLASDYVKMQLDSTCRQTGSMHKIQS